MTIWWCRSCGMEDTRLHVACSTCGSALARAEIEWLEENAEGEETVFELDPEPIERAAIVDALIHEGIRHRWEGTDELVVPDSRADDVDKILDEVLGIETSEESGGESGDFEDFDFDEDGVDGNYEVLSQLYLAADRLQNRREPDEMDGFAAATNVALRTAAPLGIDEEMWADIQAAARNAMVALEDDPTAPIDGDLKALRNQLQALV